MSVPKYDPSFTAGELKAAADKFLDAAMEYWVAAHKAGISGAVMWATSTDGRMAVITRGEYRHTLLRNIEQFGEPMMLGSVGETNESEASDAS